MKDNIIDYQGTALDKKSTTILYPSLLIRIKSLVIDYLVIILLMVIISALIGTNSDFPIWAKVVIFISIFSYEPITIAFGATLGQFLMGTRVRNIEYPAEKITLFSSYIRFIVKSLLGWISLLAISFTRNKRALHDMASQSIVVFKDY